MSKKTEKRPAIARNRRVRFDYTIESTFEAGLVLEGWEVKSLREGRANIGEAYVTMREGEAFLIGSRIDPLLSASSHVTADPKRDRKLLLHARELSQIYAAIQTRGRTCVAISLYWKGRRAKCEIGLATGRRQFDKRRAIRERELAREKQREGVE